jgi:cytochrome c-type biogenesis protein CcsB
MSEYSFIAGVLSVALALGCYVLAFASARMSARQQRSTFAGATADGGTIAISTESGSRTGLGTYGTLFVYLALTFLTASLIFRTIATGHGPFANMYEFSMAFAFGILVTYLYFERKYHQRILALVALPVALGMLLYAATIPADIEPLIPALQNNLLLTVHVATAIVAYGSFAIAFAASFLFLLQTRHMVAVVLTTAVGVGGAALGAITGGADGDKLALGYGMTGAFATLIVMGIVDWVTNRGKPSVEPANGRWGLPKPMVLDEIGYRAVVVGFPFLTLTIILGAVWAETAWGRYWSWDPKETASLVTWLIYGAYLHARVMRGWRGNRAAWLLIIGFLATLLTYFGNLIFGGLHGYSGLG